MDVKVFNSFEDIQDKWIILQNKSFNYGFSTYEWLFTWYKTIGKHKKIDQLVIVLLSNAGQEVLLPLYVQTQYSLRILRWMGDEISDYHAPLIGSEKALVHNFLNDWDCIQKYLPSCDLIWFEKQPLKIGQVDNPFFSFGKTFLIENSNSLFIDDVFEILYEKKVRTKTRSDTRRQIKRLSKQGKVSFKVAETIEEKDLMISAMISQKAHRYTITGVCNIFSLDEYQMFYRHLTFFYPQHIHLCALLVDDEIVATHWGMQFQKHFYFLMPTYDFKWQTYSVGRVLLRHLVELASSSGYKTFDFTIGDEPYKFEWCDQTTQLSTVYKVHSFLGQIFILLKFTEKQLKNNAIIHNVLRKFKRLVEKHVSI